MKRVLLVAGLMIASTVEAQVQKWEYAILTVVGDQGTTNITAVGWTVTASAHVGMGLKPEDVYKIAFNMEKNTFSLKDFVGEAGSRGWELAGIEQHDTPSSHEWITNYWFKRPMK